MNKDFNNYRMAAARLFVLHGSISEKGYLCSICDNEKECTGGGGWMSEPEAIFHVLNCHKEDISLLLKEKKKISDSHKPKHKVPKASWYPKPGNTAYDLMC